MNELEGEEEVERERKREKRDGRATSSGNSLSAEFLISSRQPPPGEECGGGEGGGEGVREKQEVEVEEEEEEEEEKVTVEGAGWARKGGIVMRAFFTDFSTPATATPRW